MKILQPDGWEAPKGYSNGIAVEGPGRTIYVAGQVAWNAAQEMVGVNDFARQFEQALANVVAVIEAGGGRPEHIVRLTIYVLSTEAYTDAIKAVGASYRQLIGRNFPAMALLQVAGLLETDALIEIEATAFVPA